MREVVSCRHKTRPFEDMYDSYYDDSHISVLDLSHDRKFGPVLIDAISFTIYDYLPHMCKFFVDEFKKFGFDFQETGHGMYHYDIAFQCSMTKSVMCFGGSKQKDTFYFSITGTGCRMLYRSSKMIEFIRYFYTKGWKIKFNRLDIAKDDFSGVFNIYELVRDGIPRRFSSNCSTFELRAKEYMDPFDNDKLKYKSGWTIYIGLRSSESFVRIYDKRKEQKLDKVIPYWVRVEFELKRNMAHEVVSRLMNGVRLDYLFCQIAQKKCRLLAERYSYNSGNRGHAAVDEDFKLFIIPEDGQIADKTSFANTLTVINYITYLVRCQQQIYSRAASLLLNHSPDEPLSAFAGDLIQVFNDKHKDLLVRIGVEYDQVTGEGKYKVIEEPGSVIPQEYNLLSSRIFDVL